MEDADGFYEQVSQHQEWIESIERNEMGRYAQESSGSGNFTPAPAGTHVAICVKIIDLGTQTGEYQGKVTIRNQVLIMWELPNEMMEAGDDGIARPFLVSKFYTNSLNEKATLRHDLEQWRSKKFTEDELSGFDLMNILGKPCMLSVVEKDGGGTKVGSVSALPKGMAVPKQFNQEFAFWLDEYDQDKFDSLSKGIQAIIQKSSEYRAIVAENFRGIEDGGRVSSNVADMTDDIPF